MKPAAFDYVRVDGVEDGCTLLQRHGDDARWTEDSVSVSATESAGQWQLDGTAQYVLITSQNHGFAVDEASLPVCLRPTHRSLFDGTLQGMHRTDRPAFGFQGHPEASPGPHETAPLFDHFIGLMHSHRSALA